MKTFRIKEKNNAFYPQYKNGWKTLWSWEYFRELGIIVYENTPYHDSWINSISSYTEWVFFKKEDAEKFIEEEKEKYNLSIPKYHYPK